MNKFLKIFLPILLFFGVNAQALYFEEIDGSTASLFRVGDFPTQQVIISEDETLDIVFLGSLGSLSGTNLDHSELHVGTGNESAGNASQRVLIRSGNTVDAISGELRLRSGLTSGTGDSGEVHLESGAASSTGTTGKVFVNSGTSDSGGDSGFVEVITGAVTGGGSSGGLRLASGQTTGAPRGNASLFASIVNIAGFDNGSNGGTVNITHDPGGGHFIGEHAGIENATNLEAGLFVQGDEDASFLTAPNDGSTPINLRVAALDASPVSTQDIAIYFGTADSDSGSSAPAKTGDVILGTGFNSDATGESGDIYIKSGNATGGTSGDSGFVRIESGTSTSGTRGNVFLNGSQVIAELFSGEFWITGGGPSPSGITSDINLFVNTGAGNAYGLVTQTDNDATADATATQSIAIETGNKTAGTGDSGDIAFTTGTSAGGARGDILFSGSKADFTSMSEIDLTGITQTGLDAATKELDNLTTTAINTDMIPAGNGVQDLGSFSKQWEDLWVRGTVQFSTDVVTFADAAFAGALRIIHNDTTSSGASVNGLQGVSSTNDLGLYTDLNPTADAVATKSVFIETGNKTAGTGDSGAISLITGTSAGGTRGNIEIDANRVIIKSDVNPDIANTTDFGTSGVPFRRARFNEFLIHVGTQLRGQLKGVGSSPSGETGIILSSEVDTFDTIVMTPNNASANATPTADVFLETGNKLAGTGDSGDIEFQTGTSAGGDRGKVTADSNLLNVLSGVATTKLSGDPCGDTTAFPESTLFYNDTSDYYCFCDGAGDDKQMHSPATACF